MISANSRYKTAVIQTAVGPDGATRQEMRVRFPRARSITYTFYRVGAGERVDTIADDFYGDGRLWWMIAEANPEIMDWADLTVGDIIRVPSGG